MFNINSVKLKAIWAWMALAALSLAVVSLACRPVTAYAVDDDDEDALYEAEVVAIANDPTVPSSGELKTYEKTFGNYKVILSGVTDANKDALADAIFENLDKGLPVKFVNDDFVDAEKYSTAYDGFDRYHCWLASTSDILTQTGWAAHYTNPLTGLPFANEDDVFAFLSSGFQDSSCLPNRAYSYFFDGIFGGSVHNFIRTTEATLIKPVVGTSQSGLDPEICSATFVRRIDVKSALSALEALEGLSDHALETTISGATSHSVMVEGAVIDESKQGEQRYVALLISDSDNDNSEATTLPATFEEANDVKSGEPNSYTLYHLSVGSDSGDTVEIIENYFKHKSNAYVGSFTQVDYPSDAVIQTATETASNATCDAKSNGDLTIYSLNLYNENNKELKVYEPTNVLELRAIIMNLNTSVEFSTATTGQAYLENRIEVYRDGNHVGTISKEAALDLEDPIDSARGKFFFVDLSRFDFMRTPGDYTLQFYLNTGNIDEAYVLDNNSPSTISYTVAGTTVYRLYNMVSSEHLWTTSWDEVSALSALPDWNFEGTAWKSPNSGVPVYRLYNAALGTHHYTANEAEANDLAANWGWTNEGVSFYSSASLDTSGNQVCNFGASAVYRLYNPGLSQHHFTQSAEETAILESQFGWVEEGSSFCAYE